MFECHVAHLGHRCATLRMLTEAIRHADCLLAGLPEGEAGTLTITNAAGHFVAVVTNRRMTGTFYKQVWGGRKGDDAIPAGEEDFDATEYVLSMPHADLVALDDNAESTDEVGRAHIDWDGPCYVTLVESVRCYFGVDALNEITQEALEFAKRRHFASGAGVCIAPPTNQLDVGSPATVAHKELRQVATVDELREYLRGIPGATPVGRLTDGYIKTYKTGDVSVFLGEVPVGRPGHEVNQVILRIST